MANTTVTIGNAHLRAYDNADGSFSLAVANQVYSALASGECIVGTAAAVLGTAAAKLAWFKASATNSGTIYLGGSGVTATDGTADTTTGIALSAGDLWGPIPIDNVSRLSGIASAASQRLTYFVVS